jgi:hypothetical protein
VHPGDALDLRFADGTAHALATGAAAGQKGGSKPTVKPKPSPPGTTGKQGSLF